MEELRSLHCLPGRGWVGGVCAGLAYWMSLPLWIVRMAAFIFVMCAGSGLLVYLLLWLFVPNASTPADYIDRTGDKG